MDENNSNEEQQIDELADRANELMDRRAVIRGTGRALVLPVLLSIGISRNAMGNSGSGHTNNSRPGNDGGPGYGGGGDRRRRRKFRWKQWYKGKSR